VIQVSLVRALIWMLAGYRYSASAQHVITQVRLLRLKFDGGATVMHMLMNTLPLARQTESYSLRLLALRRMYGVRAYLARWGPV
jgi:hypothetical protein